MKYSNVILKPDEKAVFSLRELYLKYGYLHYKVSKFEEYDLYAGNKSFLISDNILTFTDTNGKLMALKPDVTLSIVKNIGDDDTSMHKLFYNENVYRTSVSSGGFREIMQTGLECIGNIDTYSICEVLMLALQSLQTIDKDSLLVLSHMGFTLGLLEACDFTAADTKEALGYIKSKNLQAISTLAAERGVRADKAEALSFVTRFYGELSDAIEKIERFCFNERMSEAYKELCEINAAMKEKLYVDFSVVNDMNYYDGIIFNGYVNGIPDSILSGGRYDKLLSKMGKRAGAIGFAVYLDLLERFESESTEYDVDVLLVYDEKCDASDVFLAQREIVESGRTLKVSKCDDRSVKYREKITLASGR